MANVFLCALAMQPHDRDHIQELCQKYVRLVIDDEWKEMSNDRVSRLAFDTSWKLWKNIIQLKPQGESEVAIKQSMITEMSRLGDHRCVRLLRAKHGVAPVMWVVLVIGGIFNIVFTYFFAMNDVKVQILMTILVTMTLALNLLLVVFFGSTFKGEMPVQPEAFRLDQKIFESFLSDCRAAGESHYRWWLLSFIVLAGGLLGLSDPPAQGPFSFSSPEAV